MDTNNFTFPSYMVNPKRVVGVYESDALSIIITQVAMISKKLNTIGVILGLGFYVQLEEHDLTFIRIVFLGDWEFEFDWNKK